METYNISYVDLFRATLFRDHRNSESGVYSIRVYLIETDIVIRPVTIKRFKRIGLNYIKKLFTNQNNKYGVERVRQISDVKIKKLYWTHELTKEAYSEVIRNLKLSKSRYGR